MSGILSAGHSRKWPLTWGSTSKAKALKSVQPGLSTSAAALRQCEGPRLAAGLRRSARQAERRAAGRPPNPHPRTNQSPRLETGPNPQGWFRISDADHLGTRHEPENWVMARRIGALKKAARHLRIRPFAEVGVVHNKVRCQGLISLVAAI